MKTQFKKALSYNYKVFGLKSNNGSTHFGNKSLTPQHPSITIPNIDNKEKEKQSALEKNKNI
jgi:hypothetical protein